jgi:hypothetical protein
LGRDRRHAPLGLARLQALKAPVAVGVEPAPDGPGVIPRSAAIS